MKDSFGFYCYGQLCSKMLKQTNLSCHDGTVLIENNAYAVCFLYINVTALILNKGTDLYSDAECLLSKVIL